MVDRDGGPRPRQDKDLGATAGEGDLDLGLDKATEIDFRLDKATEMDLGAVAAAAIEASKANMLPEPEHGTVLSGPPDASAAAATPRKPAASASRRRHSMPR